MIQTPEVRIESVAARTSGGGDSLQDLAFSAVDEILANTGRDAMGGVVAATFTNTERFPALSIRVASHIGLAAIPAFDIQLACSAYPYALYAAGRLAADTGRKVVVIDGDVQSPFVDKSDHATGHIFSDAVTASLVSCDPASPSRSCFDFFSRLDGALECPSQGPIKMDGFKVFTFVATEVQAWLKKFIAEGGCGADEISAFLPHNANPYMVRQLAKSLGLTDRLVTADDKFLNPGSASIPLALATRDVPHGRILLAAFGAGLSASACTARLQ